MSATVSAAAQAAVSQVLSTTVTSSTRNAVRSFSSAHRVWRWGGGGSGSIAAQVTSKSSSSGGSSGEGSISKTPSLIDNIGHVQVIAAGKDHSAFVSQGRVYTYGSPKYGKLGLGDMTSKDDSNSINSTSSLPGVIESLDDIKGLACGQYHTCALDVDGNLFSMGWGGSYFSGAGALGLGDKTQRNQPEHVGNIGEPVKQVCAGALHTVILTESGRVLSTGRGEYGILGHGDNSDSYDFVEIEYFNEYRDSILNESALGKGPEVPMDIQKIGCGQNFSAALTGDGELFVWGRNDQCQLGMGEDSSGDMWSSERYPRLIRSLPLEGHKVVDFSCGDFHMDCLTENGQLFTWGNRNWLAPHPISLPKSYENGIQENIVKIVGGNKFSLALTDCGHVYAWGKKSSGCIPNDEIRPNKLQPSFFGNQKVIDIEACDSRCLAITDETERLEDFETKKEEAAA